MANFSKELERCVAERTAELLAANRLLKMMLDEGKRAEEEIRKSRERLRNLSGRRPISCQTGVSANDDFLMHQLEDHDDKDDEDRGPDEEPDATVRPRRCPVRQGGQAVQVLRAHRLDLRIRLLGRNAVVDQLLDDDLVLEKRPDLRQILRAVFRFRRGGRRSLPPRRLPGAIPARTSSPPSPPPVQ